MVEDTSPVVPVVRKMERTAEFLDLVTACHSFVAAVGRTVPGLRGRQLKEDEAALVHQNVAWVTAALDWIEQAVDTGKADMDEELTRRGASDRAPGLMAPGRKRPDVTPTPSASCLPRPGTPGSSATRWSEPVP